MAGLRELWENYRPAGRREWVSETERRALCWVVERRGPALDRLLIPLSVVTDWEFLWYGLYAALALLGDPRYRRLGQRMLVAIPVTTFGIVIPLMYLCPRKRPFQQFPEITPLSFPIDISSFPSGHTKSVWLSAVVLSRYCPAYAPAFLAVALLASYSRVYCGLHYPTDVLAGAALGLGLGLLLLRLSPELARCEG
jgi:undecaprenyl-diphosphatase